MAFNKMFHFKELVSSKQGFPVTGSAPPKKGMFIREKQTLALGLIVGSENRMNSPCPHAIPHGPEGGTRLKCDSFLWHVTRVLPLQCLGLLPVP